MQMECTSDCLQGHDVRFETRGREFALVARLTAQAGNRSESNKPATRKSQGRRLKGRVVTGARPETARSNPG